MDKTKVAIVGMGTVGTGVARLLLDHGDRTARHAGRTLVLEAVVVRDGEKPRGLRFACAACCRPICRRLRTIRKSKSSPIWSAAWSRRGRSCSSCWKAARMSSPPTRRCWPSMGRSCSIGPGSWICRSPSKPRWPAAFRSSPTSASACRRIRFNRCAASSTAPAISSSRRWKSRAPITPTRSHEAQRLGYAEADPTLDVDGSDAAQKLAILAHLAFGARVHWSDIPRRGIDRLDIGRRAIRQGAGLSHQAAGRGRTAIGRRLELHVSPTLVKLGTPLAEVRGAFNAISVVGDAVGPLMFHGQGAGQMPTASAVVADMIDTVVGRTAITFRTLELWSNARRQRRGRCDHAKSTRPVLSAIQRRRPARACWPKSPACWASMRFRSPRSFSTKPSEQPTASCRW